MGNVSESNRLLGRRFGVVCVLSSLSVCLLGVTSIGAEADTPASSSASTSTSVTAGSWAPQPAFSGAGSGVNANMNMCFGAGADAANPFMQIYTTVQAAKNQGKKGASAPGSCGHPAVPDRGRDLSCSAFGGDSSSPDAISKEIADKITQYKTIGSQLSCQQNELQGVQGQLQCLKQQGSMLQQQLATLKTVYQQNAQRFQQDVQAYKMRVADRDAQIQFVNQTLGGNPQTGKQGLVQLQQEVQGMVNAAIPQEVNKVTQQANDIAQQGQMIQEQINQRQLALMGDCFNNQRNSQYFCPAGNGPLSAAQFITCAYQHSMTVVGNHIDQNSIVQGDSQVDSSQLSNTLNNLFNQSPSNPAFPTNAQQAQAGLSNTFTVFSMTDIQNQFINQIQQQEGPAVAGWVSQALSACYSQAQYTVQTEEQEASSAIGAALYAQKKATASNQTEFTQDLQSYSQEWSKVMGTLSSQFAPMDVSQCMNASPSIEGNCLNNIQTQMQGLLNGTKGSQAFIMPVPSKFPDTQIPPGSLTCHGLSGCVQLLQQLQPQLNTAKQNLQNQQSQYVTQAKQSTQQFTDQLVQMMNQQINGGMMGPMMAGGAGLQGKIDAINQTLMSLGAGQVKFPPVQSEKQKFDKDGLPETPNNMVNFLGSQLTPPMPDVTSGDVDTQGIQDAQDHIDRNQEKVAEALNRLQADQSQCVAQANVKMISADITNFEGACGSNGTNPQGCSDANTSQDALTSLAGSLNSYALGMGSSVSTVATTSAQSLQGWLNGCGKFTKSAASAQQNLVADCTSRLQASPNPSFTCTGVADCSNYARSLGDSSPCAKDYQALNPSSTDSVDDIACQGAATALTKDEGLITNAGPGSSHAGGVGN